MSLRAVRMYRSTHRSNAQLIGRKCHAMLAVVRACTSRTSTKIDFTHWRRSHGKSDQDPIRPHNKCALRSTGISIPKISSDSTHAATTPRQAAGGQLAARLCAAEKRRAPGGARSAHQQLTRRGCLNEANAVSEVSSATRQEHEHRRAVGVFHRPAQRSADGCPAAAWRARSLGERLRQAQPERIHSPPATSFAKLRMIGSTGTEIAPIPPPFPATDIRSG